ncbi:hypothetical protein K1719_007172 [Acacia pycnantha]|nr:hypothetical protein K1719_007172 [Acacia pycnantha]
MCRESFLRLTSYSKHIPGSRFEVLTKEKIEIGGVGKGTDSAELAVAGENGTIEILEEPRQDLLVWSSKGKTNGMKKKQVKGKKLSGANDKGLVWSQVQRYEKRNRDGVRREEEEKDLQSITLEKVNIESDGVAGLSGLELIEGGQSNAMEVNENPNCSAPQDPTLDSGDFHLAYGIVGRFWA